MWMKFEENKKKKNKKNEKPTQNEMSHTCVWDVAYVCVAACGGAFFATESDIDLNSITS